ncbi:polysaccharide deacetylase family protein [Myceligenerans crystallogenes]|uniref:Polysaccharide deacetylase family protein n=1 Tax=Myceligenerans crystallogenes TaxID=316335 RepID=A0ABN2N8J2_9MICO
MSKTFTTVARPRTGRVARVLTAAGAAAAAVLTGLVAAPAATAADCSSGYVALTFDDGPNSGTSTQIINTLKQYGATAVMFPTGQNAQNNASLMQAYQNAGLQIGNHSWDHPHLTQLSSSQVQTQLSNTSNVIQQTTGVRPQLFRPPYGESNSTIQQIASSLGMRQIIWDVDSTDWNNASSSTIRQRAAQLTNGQNILMHDWPSATVQALPGILQDLQNRNLCTGHISPSTGRAVAASGSTPTTPPPTTAPPTTPPPTTAPPTSQPPVTGTCSARLTVVNSWGGGYQANVTVTAGSSGTNGWTTTFALPSGSSVSSLWNATHTVSGSTVTAKNVSWNGTLGAGQSATYGFTATGTAPSSTVTCA